ncbi:MAG: hypothetical protein SGILL_006404 [Bacillariaceae sp.]
MMISKQQGKGLSLLLALAGAVEAFVTPSLKTTPSVKSASSHQQQAVVLPFLQPIAPAPPRCDTTLFYRKLDGSDDDATRLKLQSKLPPTFDARKALSEEEQKQPSSGMNTQFIVALLINQALILGIASALGAVVLLVTQGPSAFSNLSQILHWEGLSPTSPNLFDLTPTPQRIAFGVIGSIPLLISNYLIEQSDRRIFANINFSTITMVMTLFGRRSQPDPTFLPDNLKGRTFPTTSMTQAFAASLALSVVTGFCEETVFRREVAGVLGTCFLDHNIALILVAQAFLFALGHVQPNASTSRSENSVLIGLQLVNGLGFGAIYLAAGGDIVPSMVAHALYDFIDFFKVWLDANGQLEYAEKMWKTDLPPEDRKEVEQVLRKMGMSMNDNQYKRLRRLFYTFDFDKNMTLSRSEVRKGIAYMAVERAGDPPANEQVDFAFDQVKAPGSDRLSVPDFLNLIMISGGAAGKKRMASAG